MQVLLGGEPKKLLHNVSTVVEASPTDPNQIIAGYYDPNAEGDPRKCVLISLEESGIKKDFGFVRIQPTFDWSADGKGIYFPKINSLQFLSILDNQVSEITSLKDMRIINLSTSPDGKTLAITGEERSSNILKIDGFKTPTSLVLR